MIIRCPDPAAFRDRAGTFLLADEQRHHLQLRILESHLRHGSAGTAAPWWLVAERDGVVIATAMMTPPHQLVIGELDNGTLREILAFVLDHEAPLPGVNGPADATARFAAAWTALTGGTSAPHRRLRLFSTTTSRSPDGVPGRMRPASEPDLPLLAGWFAGFDSEALQQTTAPEAAYLQAQRFIGRGGVVIWEDGEPRAMANATVPTGSGVCINGVWTPPGFRRRGYATACVAGLTDQLLRAGRSYVCLFTDLANPVSNSIYPKIGYAPIVDFTEYRLIPPG